MEIAQYMKENPTAPVEDVAIRFNCHVDEVRKHVPKRRYSSAEVVAMFKRSEGLTARQLAKDIGKSYQYVARCLSEAGIDFKQRTQAIKELKRDALDTQFKALHELNYAVPDICNALGISSATVTRIAKRLGLDLNEARSNRRDSHVKRMLELRTQGVPFEDIAEELGITKAYAINLASHARMEGVPIPNLRDKHGSIIRMMVEENIPLEEIAKELNLDVDYVQQVATSKGLL